MRTFMHRVSLVVALLGLSAASQAAEWILEPGSQVTFEYSYGTDPYEGRFTNVQANFDIDVDDDGKTEEEPAERRAAGIVCDLYEAPSGSNG